MIRRRQTTASRKGPRPGACRGFTLIELMIVLVIVGVILGVGLPAFRSVNLATRLTGYANELVTSVNLARGESIKRNAAVRLCASADGATCATGGGWQQGWVVLDPNDVVLGGGEALAAGYSAAETIAGTLTLTFDASGAVTPASTFKICRQTPEVGNQERRIELSTIGRTNVTRTTTGTCP